jgi:uncharacterized Fe-S cluster protein YjdI
VEHIEGRAMTLIYEGHRCIHSRFCVTGAPRVFLANVKGPWIHPDAIDVERLVAIAEECPSAAIRYRRKDGRVGERPDRHAGSARRDARAHRVSLVTGFAAAISSIG